MGGGGGGGWKKKDKIRKKDRKSIRFSVHETDHC